MGRLANLSYRKVVEKLKKLEFEFYRQAAGSHEIWYNPKRNLYTTIPNHPGDVPEGTIRAILKQAQISTEAFLKA
ncbi:MAG: type II toxin-antitoxin system HicA family toxin [Candidatus Marinimicrobia bacterium]|nr:type II toxin-antitoxin system HicA family toxin [Candidatus Neomarinimicrobiota bacterium]